MTLAEEIDATKETVDDEIPTTKMQLYRDIAQKWFANRDLEEVSSSVLAFPEQNSFFVFLRVSKAVNHLYGYEEWVLFVNELIKTNPAYRKIYQKNITKTFANMIIGAREGTKKNQINSPAELLDAIVFLENNSPLRGPKIDSIRVDIQKKIIKKNFNRETWDRIISVIPDITPQYLVLQETKFSLSYLSMRRRKYFEEAQSPTKISNSDARRRLRKHKNDPAETRLKLYENLLFKSRIRSKRVRRKLLANFAFLYGLKYEYLYDLAREFLRISETLFLNLKHHKKALECYFNSLRLFYLRETEAKRFYLSLWSLETIKKQFAMNPQEHLFVPSTKFLVKSYLDMYNIFKEKRIYGVAESCLDSMQINVNNMKETEDSFFQLYNPKISERRVELKEITSKIVFVFDTSFMCSIFGLYSTKEERELIAIFDIIQKFFDQYSELQYVAMKEIKYEIPQLFYDHTKLIQKALHFQKYPIDYKQIENLKILNAQHTSRSFDQDEVADYIIIQNAVNHKSSENIVIIVSNDEGIHKYCKKNLPGKKIAVIWCHSLIEFISQNVNIENETKILHNLAGKMKKNLEKYRMENKRRKIESYPVEQLLLSLELEDRD